MNNFTDNLEILRSLTLQENQLIQNYMDVDVTKNPEIAYQLQGKIRAIRSQKLQIHDMQNQLINGAFNNG